MNDRIATLAGLIDAKSLDRVALVAAAALTILLAASLARLTWTVLPQLPQAAPPAGQVAVGSVAVTDFRRIARLHLFGQATAVAAGNAPVDAPDTRLNLTLRGILFNSIPELARVIIAAAGKQDQMYKVGDEVAAGVRIDQIYADRVMLLRDGRYETLRLPEDRLSGAVSGGGEESAASPNLPSAGGGALAEYRRQIIENPQEAGQFIQAAPVPKSSGGIAGFRVEPGADPGMFQLSGLQPGDIVTAVNDVQLDTLDKGFQAIEELAAAGGVTLKVLRGGQEQTIRLQLQNNR